MYAELERKQCRRCKTEKPLNEFRYREKKSFGTYESYCVPCEKQNQRRWYRVNKDKLKERDFGRNCQKFGLTTVEYQQMVEAQKGVCAICNQPEIRTRSGKIKNLAIDHCHMTGQIRALLCCDCNTAIGLLKENPQIALAASRYLRKFKK